MRALAVVALFAVVACTQPPPASVCPMPVPYSREIQARAANELRALPPDSALAVMMADYAQVRAQLRLCQ